MAQQVSIEAMAKKIASEDIGRPSPASTSNHPTPSMNAYAAIPWDEQEGRRAASSSSTGRMSGASCFQSLDPVNAAHLVLYGVTPSSADLVYWKSEMDRVGSLREVMEHMSRARGTSIVEFDQEILRRLTEVGANQANNRTTPVVFFVRAYSTYLNRSPTFGEIEDLLLQILRDNTGPLDVEYSLRERATVSDLKPLGLVTKLLKSGSWLGRRLLFRRFNLVPFDRAAAALDYHLLGQLSAITRIREDIRMVQVQLSKMISE